MALEYSPLHLDCMSLLSIQQWRTAYPVNYSNGIGVNLQAPVFEIGEEDQIFVYQSTQLQDTHSHSNFDNMNSVQFLSPFLVMLVKNDGGEQKAIFSTWLCTCDACNRKVDTMRMKPVTQRIKLRMPFDENEKLLAMTFYPGVTADFNMRMEGRLCEPQHVIYFSSFMKLTTWNVIPFQRYSSALSVMDIREVQPSVPDTWTSPEVVFNTMEPLKEAPLRFARVEKIMEPNVELVSSDGELFSCHQFILSCHSPVFRKIIATEENVKPETRMTFHVSEPAVVVGHFLQSIYFPNVKLLESLGFETCYGVLKLACLYEVMDLLGVVSKVMIRKLEHLVWKDVVQVQRLHNFLQTVGNFQLVAFLKTRVCYTIRRLLIQEKISLTGWCTVSNNMLVPLIDLLSQQCGNGLVQELIRVVRNNEV